MTCVAARSTPVSACLVATFAEATGVHVTLASCAGKAGPRRQNLVRGEASLPVRWRHLLASDPVAAVMALPITAHLQMDEVPARRIAAVVGRGGRLRGDVSMEVEVSGTVAAPQVRGTASLEGVGRRRARVRELRVDGTYDGATGTVTAKVRGEQEGGGTLAVDGEVALDDLASARGTIRATDFDLAPLARLVPSTLVVGVRGHLDADAQLVGADPSAGRWSGVVRLREAELPIHPLVGTLRDGDVTVSLRGAAVTVRARGAVGDGAIRLEARAELDGLLPRTAHAELQVQDVRLINEVQPTVSAKVTADLRRDGEVWRPTLVVRDAVVRVPEASGAELHDAEVPGDVVFVENGHPPAAQTAPPPSQTAVIGQRPRRPYLIATLELGPTRVETTEVEGVVRGRLVATVGEDAIAIDGDIRAERAELDLFDRRYRVERAEVHFDGSDDPVLDVVVTHDFPTLSLRVAVGGRLSAPTLRLTSDPPSYSEGQLLSFLLGGAPGAEPGSELRDAATGVASSLLSQKISGYVSPYLPIDLDVLKFEAATSSSSAAFTVGKWLTRRLFLAYRQRVEARPDQNSGEAEVEYWLGRRVVLEGVVGDEGIHGLDLVWTRRW
ncbi:MAG: translocation/assembly module TamB domain-containing protein [Kofleriaceae bacterium]